MIYELPEGHGWSARPGHKILVLDRGAVLLEYPRDWHVEPGPGQIDLRDRETVQESTCVLAVSYLRLPPLDWRDLPLSELLSHAVDGNERDLIAAGPVTETARDDLEIAWIEQRVVDPGENRESRSRTCLVRGKNLQCLITFDFWPEDEARVSPVWDDVLESVKLGVEVEDPTRGRRIE